MKNIILTVLAAGLAAGANAAPVIGFDDLSLPPESYYNGSDEAGGFFSRGVHFNNDYDTEWEVWSGFSYSNVTDNVTTGWTNQYSAVTGADRSGSGIYAVSFTGRGGSVITLPEDYQFLSMRVTNTTYAYYSMLEGDDFAKKFGGETGEDPDWFRLDVTGHDRHGAVTGDTFFYLADFRGTDDYIVSEWELLDLSPLANAATATFTLSSSDVGTWGMNTPAYFAMDSLTAIPEPRTYGLLLALAVAAMLSVRRRKRQ